ncbi:MAG: flippase [Aeromonas sp.]
MSLVKNSIWNLSGYIMPTLISIPALGYLARELGVERFGFLTLAMAIVGYASIFDAGLTRAVIREIAIQRDNEIEKNKVIATSACSVFIFGVIGTSLMYIFSSNIIYLLNIEKNLFNEVDKSLSILALSIPFFLLNQIWLAILEGEERFANINIQKSISGSLIAGLPALLVFLCHESLLISAICGLVLSRILTMLLSFALNKTQIINAGFYFNKATFARLFRFGGWITVSNIISPIMSYFDRFIVSNVAGAGVVAYYTAPSEVVSRLGVIPFALSRAIFPKFSANIGAIEKNKHKRLGYILLVVCCLPIVCFLIYMAKPLLVLWMGADYAGVPVDVLQILLIGFFFNSLAQIPFASIQGAGASRITAFLHMVELLPYLMTLYFLVHKYSLIGAAIAWSLRVLIDFILLVYFDMRFTKNSRHSMSELI